VTMRATALSRFMFVNRMSFSNVAFNIDEETSSWPDVCAWVYM